MAAKAEQCIYVNRNEYKCSIKRVLGRYVGDVGVEELMFYILDIKDNKRIVSDGAVLQVYSIVYGLF